MRLVFAIPIDKALIMRIFYLQERGMTASLIFRSWKEIGNSPRGGAYGGWKQLIVINWGVRISRFLLRRTGVFLGL